MFAWIMALLLHFHPQDFSSLNLAVGTKLILRIITSFAESSVSPLCLTARFRWLSPLPYRSSCKYSPAGACRLYKHSSGCCRIRRRINRRSSCLRYKKDNGYPRISLTVPSIVIMVPGLYLYRAFYNLGIMSLTEAVSWLSSAIMIIITLPLGLIFARILTDRTFRYCT